MELNLKNNKDNLRTVRNSTRESHAIREVPPFLRWAGSKRQLLPMLSQYWRPSYARYVEPFAGSACFFFSVSPKKALLGDINAHLIETLSTVRDDVESVVPLLAHARRDRELYYHIRSLDPRMLSRPERAARFIYLNRYCFNGLFRTNEAGDFNVPYGGRRTGSIPSEAKLRECSLQLVGADLTATSFEITLRKTKKGDFVYLDPPYSVAAKRVFRQYDAMAFDAAKIELLRFWLHKLATKSVQFLATYADSHEGRYLAEGFNVRRARVRRNIAGFVAKRRHAYELLISN